MKRILALFLVSIFSLGVWAQDVGRPAISVDRMTAYKLNSPEDRLAYLTKIFLMYEIDVAAVMPKLIEKNYLGADYYANRDFTNLDTEFKGWFPAYGTREFFQIEYTLGQLRDNQREPGVVYHMGG